MEEALAAERLEHALDLAWRAVQLGPRDDAALMFLLARAQSRGGRPQDALVMVRRLAERGVATDAATHPDLVRMRSLPGWPDVQVVVARTAARAPLEAPAIPAETAALASTATRAPAAASLSPAPSAAAAAAARVPRRGDAPGVPARSAPGALVTAEARVTEEALRVSSDPFVPAGLAYDAVSRRFVMGDERGRKLRVVGEGFDHAVDFVGAGAAGFLDIRALAIDRRRGDLWVATSDREGTAGHLHRLQLISGRPLQTWPLDGGGSVAVQPIDLAVAESGAVYVLDRGGRLHRARAGAAAVELVLALPGPGPMLSLAIAGDTAAYITHESGLLHVDLTDPAVADVIGPPGLPLTGIERLRAHREGFVALQRGPDGSRRLLRLEFVGSGRAVRRATTYDVRVEAGPGTPELAVTGDEVSLVSRLDAPAGAVAPASALGPPAEIVVRRLRLR